MFCKKCGGKLENYATHCAFCGAEVEKLPTGVGYVKGNNKGETTSVAKWFFIPFINLIPVVGSIIYFILLLVWGFGHSKDNDPTFKNWAKAQLLLFLIGVVLIIIYFVFIAAIGVSFFSSFEDLANSAFDSFPY